MLWLKLGYLCLLTLIVWYAIKMWKCLATVTSYDATNYEVLEDIGTFLSWRCKSKVLVQCLTLQARPACVSIDEQMIPFTGACTFLQYVPLKPNPVGMRNFGLASVNGIVLDFEVYQGANTPSSQAQEVKKLGLGALVIAHLAKSLHPGTKVYCDWFSQAWMLWIKCCRSRYTWMVQ